MESVQREIDVPELLYSESRGKTSELSCAEWLLGIGAPHPIITTASNPAAYSMQTGHSGQPWLLDSERPPDGDLFVD